MIDDMLKCPPLNLKYFTAEEFRNCQPSCTIDDMSRLFLQKLDRARFVAGVPFKLNSAYRSESYELSHKRNGTSSHCKGIAVDIACTDSFSRLRILSALIMCGFNRIGIAKRYIHVDADTVKPACIWLY